MRPVLSAEVRWRIQSQSLWSAVLTTGERFPFLGLLLSQVWDSE